MVPAARGKKLGGLAMLRNVRNMRRRAWIDLEICAGHAKVRLAGCCRSTSSRGAAQSPVRAGAGGQVLRVLRGKGRRSAATVILVDVSGSMDAKLSGRSEMTRMDVACSLAMIGREMFDESPRIHLLQYPGRGAGTSRFCAA